MKEIDLLKIFKNAPEGIEVYSIIFGKCNYIGIIGEELNFTPSSGNMNFLVDSQGRYSTLGEECTVFPTKFHRNWENWQSILMENIENHVIVDAFGVWMKGKNANYAVINKGIVVEDRKSWNYSGCRFATPDEEKEFFKNLKDIGYEWDFAMSEPLKLNEYFAIYVTPRFDLENMTSRKGDTRIIKKGEGLKVTNEEPLLFPNVEVEDIYGQKYNVPKGFLKHWSIEDAKNGDVIVDDDFNMIFIFNKIDGASLISNATYDNDGLSSSAINKGSQTSVYTNSYNDCYFLRPATFKEKATLSLNMLHRGYMWSPEYNKVVEL